MQIVSRGKREFKPDSETEVVWQAVEQSIADRFESIVHRFPQRIAVKAKTGSVSYQELKDRADRVGQNLLRLRGPVAEPILLLMDTDADLFCAIFGILRSGKCYVPLDPLYPKTRIRHIVEDSGSRILLTDYRNQSLANEVAGNQVSVINVESEEFAQTSGNSGMFCAPDTLASIIYTSGSTGARKGVMQNHRNTLHKVMEYTNSWRLCSDDRFALLYSYSTSGAVRDIFSALLNGACLCPFNVREEGIARLAQWLIDEEITIYNSVASLFRQFAGSLTDQDEFPKLRLIHVGSEAIYKKEVAQYQRHFANHCVFVARYGTSEISPICQFVVHKETELTAAAMPLGYPALDTEVLLLNDDGIAVGVNQIGEIAVRSRYLTPGYWQRPDLTKNTFLAGPKGKDERIFRTGDVGRRRQDGCLEYLGRKDFRVKIRGFSVEVAEIERVLIEHPDIRESVVVAGENKTDETRLVAYVVLKQQSKPVISEVRRYLRTNLPDYMVPPTVVILEALPLNPNGKVDRQALPPPDMTECQPQNSIATPRDHVERQLIQIWEKLLGIQPIGVENNFFDLGGHSLLVAQLMQQIEICFGKKVPLATLFERPTIESLAQILRPKASLPQR